MDAAKNALSAAPNGHVQKATDAPSVSPKTVQVAKTDLDVAQLVAEASSSSSSSIRSSSSMEALETYTQPKLSAPPVQQQQHFSMPNQTEPKPLGHFHEFSPKITVIGVGGAGGNAVSNMVARDLQGVEFTVCNTDAQHLSTCLTDNCIQLGRSTTQGLGCGANPDAGKMAALESRDEIMEQIEGSHMVFITAGMGGGTGTGAAPVIAETCLDAGILTVAVVTQPFRFEVRCC
jgi:cell division GTPase FtsZ